ncbi:gamma-secretase subunit APH-1A isoform X3 [Pyrgilauda ruficollis]|uniref:gamma-secretase subunit APH-1A isoform X3 n=1 Tax=Pyrgilauda ruficollis TaxID=221976 RepID=UPI001B861E9B|nr:gamma-secretase subunit APH-1A isoform X3 [Pyrgilauda ruficollis]
MGAAVLLGCAAIALGPAAALVLLTVAAEPLLVIVLLAGKADEGLAILSEDGRSPISLRQMAYGEQSPGCCIQLSCPSLSPPGLWRPPDPGSPTVSGLSFGIISGVFSITNILADSAGPGTVGIHGDSPYFFITSAFLTMALVLLHTFWGIIFFDACERRRAGGLGLVVGSHLLTSGLTFLNPWYEASLGPIFILTLCTGLWAFSTAGGSFYNVLKCLSCKQEPEGQAMLYSALQVPPEG